MSTSLWILFSFVLIVSALYVVSLIKNFNLINNISSIIVLPLIGATNLTFLQHYYPDSFHISLITLLVYITILLTQVCFLFNKKQIFSYLGIALYILASILWCDIYISAVYIYRISFVYKLIFIIISGLIAAGTCIFSGKQKIYVYVVITTAVFIAGLLAYFTFAFLIYGKKISAILLSAGAIANIALIIMYSLDKYKFNLKYGNTIKLAVLIAAQTLISYSNVLMLK